MFLLLDLLGREVYVRRTVFRTRGEFSAMQKSRNQCSCDLAEERKWRLDRRKLENRLERNAKLRMGSKSLFDGVIGRLRNKIERVPVRSLLVNLDMRSDLDRRCLDIASAKLGMVEPANMLHSCPASFHLLLRRQLDHVGHSCSPLHWDRNVTLR